MQPVLGMNPNKNIEDEYIHNLQQQMHFMELEIKLLKDKVIEDDETSGIGSLFNDESYSQMRSDYLMRIEAIDKERIRISEEAFILEAQINILSEQNNKMEQIRDHDEKERLDKISELEKKYRELYKHRKELEEQLKRLNRELEKQRKDNYEYNIQLTNEQQDDEHCTYRHDRDMAQAEERFKQKEEELAKVNTDLDNIQKLFEANPEYQANEEQIQQYLRDSKAMFVEMHLLKRQVEEMTKATELYKKAVEDEKNKKRKLIEKNKKLKKETDSKDQTERMRMQKLMNDTKDPDLRELMISSAKISESVNDLEGNLEKEKLKYDKLQDQKLVLDRLNNDMNQSLEKHRAIKEAQDGELPGLKTNVKDLEDVVTDLEKQQATGLVLNKEVEGKYRKLA
jgi:chromosome segregation ATPase